MPHFQGSACRACRSDADRPLIFIYYGEGVSRRSVTRLLTRNAARRIAASIAKLPSLLRNGGLDLSIRIRTAKHRPNPKCLIPDSARHQGLL